MTAPIEPDQDKLETTLGIKRKRVTRISPEIDQKTKRVKPNDRPRWHTQPYLLFLALRQHPERSLPRGQLIKDALALDRKFSQELGLPVLYRGQVSDHKKKKKKKKTRLIKNFQTPDNSASSVLTKNEDRYFIPFKPEGSRSMHFRLAYEPGNVDTAVQEYQKWLKKLVEHDWPYCFGIPKVSNAANYYYHTPLSEVDEEVDQRSIKEDTNHADQKLERVCEKLKQKSTMTVEKEPNKQRLKRVTRSSSRALLVSSTTSITQQLTSIENMFRLTEKTIDPVNTVEKESNRSRFKRVTRSSSRTVPSSVVTNQQLSSVENTVKPEEKPVDSLKAFNPVKKDSKRQIFKRVTRSSSEVLPIPSSILTDQQLSSIENAFKPAKKPADLVEKASNRQRCKRVTGSSSRALPSSSAISTTRQLSSIENTFKSVETPVDSTKTKEKTVESNRQRFKRATRSSARMLTVQQLSSTENTFKSVEEPEISVKVKEESDRQKFKRVTRSISRMLPIPNSISASQLLSFMEITFKPTKKTVDSVKTKKESNGLRFKRVTRSSDSRMLIKDALETAKKPVDSVKSKKRLVDSNRQRFKRVTRSSSRALAVPSTISTSLELPSIENTYKPTKKPVESRCKRITRSNSRTASSTISVVHQSTSIENTFKPLESRFKRITRSNSQTASSTISVVHQSTSIENTFKPLESRFKRITRSNSQTASSTSSVVHQSTSIENTFKPLESRLKRITRSHSQTLTVPSTMSTTKPLPVKAKENPVNNKKKKTGIDPCTLKDKPTHSLLFTKPNQENGMNKHIPEPLYTLDQLDLTNIPQSWRDIVTIAPSKITRAGNGLFATRTLPYNTPIGFYFGVPMTEDEYDSLKDRVGRASEYSIKYRRTVLDATDDQGEPITDELSPRFCPFHFMNETKDAKDASVAFVEGYVVNQVICWTRKEIQPGEELLAWYGLDVNRYWLNEEQNDIV
jgi:hypothetical protein